MTAIYKGKVYKVADDNHAAIKLTPLDSDVTMDVWVEYMSPDLIIDPTDDEINNICPDYNL